MMNQVVIGIGSNISPEENIKKAIEEISNQHSVLVESKFVKTEPIGFIDQPYFLNGALCIETDLLYDDLKSCLIKIENKLGRVRGVNKWGPRPIDLDIVVWNRKVVDDDVYKRDFLQNAVIELLPDLDILI